MACPVVKATVAASVRIGVRPRREYAPQMRGFAQF
jgi:hypothetical protein